MDDVLSTCASRFIKDDRHQSTSDPTGSLSPAPLHQNRLGECEIRPGLGWASGPERWQVEDPSIISRHWEDATRYSTRVLPVGGQRWIQRRCNPHPPKLHHDLSAHRICGLCYLGLGLYISPQGVPVYHYPVRCPLRCRISIIAGPPPIVETGLDPPDANWEDCSVGRVKAGPVVCKATD